MLLLLLSALVVPHPHHIYGWLCLLLLPRLYADIFLSPSSFTAPNAAILQKYLDNFDLSIKVVYIVGTLVFAVGQLLVISAHQPVVELTAADLMHLLFCLFPSKELQSWLSSLMFMLLWL